MNARSFVIPTCLVEIVKNVKQSVAQQRLHTDEIYSRHGDQLFPANCFESRLHSEGVVCIKVKSFGNITDPARNFCCRPVVRMQDRPAKFIRRVTWVKHKV